MARRKHRARQRAGSDGARSARHGQLGRATAAPAVTAASRPLLSWAALGVVYFVWGGTYLAIRVGDRHLPPLVLAGTRYVVAGGLLYPIALRVRATSRAAGPAGPRRPGLRAWLAGGLVGILLLSMGNGGVTVAETRLPSGLAAVLVATVPLWMLLFAWPLRHQRLAWRSVLGLVAGLAGVGVLTGGGAASGHLSGVLIVLGAAVAWGFGSVLSHRLPLPSDAMVSAAIEMLVGGAVLILGAVVSGELSRVHLSSVPATSWIALAYLVVLGSVLAFTAYGYALKHLPVATVSTYAYVNPVVAVAAGALLLGEHVTWSEALGALLVVGSVAMTLRRAPARTTGDDGKPPQPA
ncbi:MAG: EamA family transporter [Acidimicrobiales bacterium]